MYKILTLNNISLVGLRRLPRALYEVSSDIRTPDAILVRSHKMHTMEIPDSVLAVARAGAGVNNIPVDALSKRGIPVFNSPGANANAVKELVLASILMAARNLPQAWEYVRDLDTSDPNLEANVEAGKKRFVGFELPGRTLGVVGLGAIGVQVANAALALGMKVIGYDPKISVQRAWQLSSGVAQAVSLDDVCSRADVLSVHVPLIESTERLIDRRRIGLMRKGTVLANFARLGVIDEAAVVEALDDGRLHCYATDFPAPESKSHPKVLALPHLGASTHEAEENCAIMAADNLREYLENGNVRNSVNFPEAVLPRGDSRERLTVIISNVPGVVGAISTVLGQWGLNIAELLNQSRGEIGYVIADVEGQISAELVAEIRALPEVLAARTFPAPNQEAEGTFASSAA